MIDKDKAYTTVMGRRRNADGSTSEALMKPSEVKTEDGEMDPRHEAAKDILAAVHDKHPGKLMEALKAFQDLHSMMPEEEAEEESTDSAS